MLDLFGGSYAVPRAAQQTFRRSIASELDPELHRTAQGLVEKELHEDPVHGHDWTEIAGLDREETNLADEVWAK